MTTTVQQGTDSSAEPAAGPKRRTAAEVRRARENYVWQRRHDVQGDTHRALLQVALTDDDPADSGGGSTQDTLRNILGGVAPERRWALAGEIARLGHALWVGGRGGRLPYGTPEREAVLTALTSVLRDALAAQLAGLRFLFGGVR